MSSARPSAALDRTTGPSCPPALPAPPAPPALPALSARRLRNLQHLSRLNLVGIRQLVAIGVEDVHVGVRIAKLVARDPAQGVARLDRIRRLAGSRCGPANRLDVGDDVLLPGRNRLDRVPDLVCLLLSLNGALEIELTVALLGRAFHSEALGSLNCILVAATQFHEEPPLISGRQVQVHRQAAIDLRANPV